MEAALSVVTGPDTDFTPYESRVAEPRDSSPSTDSEPPTSVPIESDWALIMEFTSADIFQHSPLGGVLNSLKSLSLCQETLGPTMSDSSGKRVTKKFVPHPPPTW